MKRITGLQTAMSIRNYTALDAALALGNYNTSCIWSNNGAAPVGNWFIPPAQGDGENQVQGTKYNLKYCELIFGLFPAVSITPAVQGDFLRIFLIRERQANQAITGLADIMQTSDFMSPIRTKSWDVQFDRIYCLKTGLSYGIAGGPNSVVNDMPSPMKFRFIIPLKHTMLLQNVNAQFPLHMYMYAMLYATDRWLTTTTYTYTYYFQDP